MSGFLRFRLNPWGLLGALAFTAGAASLAGFFGSLSWALDILSHFRAQYALGFLLLAALFAAGRKWKAALGSLALACANALPILCFLLPPAAAPDGNAPSFRAMLMNVNTACGDPARVRAAIADAQPDLLVLEEISRRWLEDLAPVLETYPYRITEPRHDNFGIGLFSRRPLAAATAEPFGIVNIPSLFAEVTLGGRTLAIVATHPLPPGGALLAAERDRHLEWLARKVAAIPPPVLLLGDLNTSPWSPHYRRFLKTSGLRDSARGRSIRPTWPAPYPLLWIPLDHALHSPGIAIRARTVGPAIGSDHYPLVVDFSWAAASPAERR